MLTLKCGELKEANDSILALNDALKSKVKELNGRIMLKPDITIILHNHCYSDSIKFPSFCFSWLNMEDQLVGL